MYYAIGKIKLFSYSPYFRYALFIFNRYLNPISTHLLPNEVVFEIIKTKLIYTITFIREIRDTKITGETFFTREGMVW